MKFDYVVMIYTMKINLGGETEKDGWKIFNAQKKPGVDFVGNIEDLSQFKDESIKEIYASHIIEHIDQKTIKNTLKGIYRILEKNGKFYISVPDMEILCHLFISPLANKDMKFHVMRMIFGGQVDKYDYHYFGWTHHFMHDYLKETGFSKIDRVGTFGLFDDTSDFKIFGLPVSLNVVAIK